MLVVEHRHDAAVLLEDLDDIVEETLPWILALAFLVHLVIAVFGDRENRVDGERVASSPQGLANRRINRDVQRFRDLARHILGGELVDVKGHDVHAGIGFLAVEKIRAEEILENHVTMAAIGPLGDHRGNLEALTLGARVDGVAGRGDRT